jgi:hypothetical protein
MTVFGAYLDEIKKNLAHGDATEHTHRPALKKLLETVSKGITATNEPTRILCGAPDFNITKGKIPLGHVETKGIGENLTAMEKGKPPYGEQFGRYHNGLRLHAGRPRLGKLFSGLLQSGPDPYRFVALSGTPGGVAAFRIQRGLSGISEAHRFHFSKVPPSGSRLAGNSASG